MGTCRRRPADSRLSPTGRPAAGSDSTRDLGLRGSDSDLGASEGAPGQDSDRRCHGPSLSPSPSRPTAGPGSPPSEALAVVARLPGSTLRRAAAAKVIRVEWSHRPSDSTRRRPTDTTDSGEARRTEGSTMTATQAASYKATRSRSCGRGSSGKAKKLEFLASELLVQSGVLLGLGT